MEIACTLRWRSAVDDALNLRHYGAGDQAGS